MRFELLEQTREREAKRMSERIKQLREQLIKDGVLEEQEPGRFVFIKDYNFTSAAEALSIFEGREISEEEADELWKLPDGRTLGDIKRSRER
jgi:hypothetical protein